MLAFRHWIGRAPGQDLKLYRGLIEKKKFTPLEAETVLSLLHSFGDEELVRIETYELLVGCLGNEQLPIRGLAGWHLKRLIDEKKFQAFGFDPVAPKCSVTRPSLNGESCSRKATRLSLRWPVLATENWPGLKRVPCWSAISTTICRPSAIRHTVC